MFWRPPTVAEVLKIAAAVAGTDAVKLADQKRLIAIEHAVDQPEPAAPADMQAAWRAAQLADELLSRADLPDPPRCVHAVLMATLERSGMTWSLDGLSTVMYLQAWQRGPGELRGLAEWAQRHLEVSDALLHPDPGDWGSLLPGDPDESPEWFWLQKGRRARGLPTLYLGGPFANLEPDTHAFVDFTSHQAAVAIESAIARHPLPAPVRLLHPSFGLLRADLRRTLTDREWLVTSRRLLLSHADAYILTDVAQRAPGFGAAIEFLYHAGAYGPTAILIDEACPGRSRFETGLAPDLDATLLHYAKPTEMAATLGRWAFESLDDILAAHRRRLNEQLLNTRALAELRRLVVLAPPSEMRSALYRSGLTIDYVRLLLAEGGDALFSVTPWRQRERFVETLRSSIQQRRPTLPRAVAHRVSHTALREAARRRGWDRSYTRELAEVAQRQLARANAESRLSLQTPEAWIRFSDRYGRTR